MNDTNIDYKLSSCYKSRNITSTSKPKFKLYAFCINLEDRKQNMEFIYSEWYQYLNIKRFIALSSPTKSHIQILRFIFINKNIINFPIVIMEDDVYRKNNFTKYWNELLDLKNCDYVSLDAFFLVFNDNQNNVPSNFVSLQEHRAMGFNIYYKNFFDKFTSLEEFNQVLNKGIIDMNLTHNPLFINYTPKEQICCQIVSKFSTSAKRFTNEFIEYYKIAEEKLKNI